MSHGSISMVRGPTASRNARNPFAKTNCISPMGDKPPPQTCQEFSPENVNIPLVVLGSHPKTLPSNHRFNVHVSNLTIVGGSVHVLSSMMAMRVDWLPKVRTVFIVRSLRPIVMPLLV